MLSTIITLATAAVWATSGSTDKFSDESSFQATSPVTKGDQIALVLRCSPGQPAQFVFFSHRTFGGEMKITAIRSTPVTLRFGKRAAFEVQADATKQFAFVSEDRGPSYARILSGIRASTSGDVLLARAPTADRSTVEGPIPLTGALKAIDTTLTKCKKSIP